MTNLKELAHQAQDEILDSLKYLKYSYERVKNLTVQVDLLSPAELEAWDGLVIRFGRTSDIYISKYLKSSVLLGDPGFRGTLRDFLDQAEKQGLIESTDLWMRLRELRNISVHEYSKVKISAILEELRHLTPHLLRLEERLKK